MHTLYHKRIPKTIPKDSIDGHGTSTGKKNPHYHSLPCVVLLQRKPHLRSATVGLLSLPSHTANLHTIAKALTLMHPSIDKSKCLTHLRCTVIKTNQILK